ncbi:hypothetical protein S40285_10060 [Stachybotrys chlorohalonatus IBT 40285]|uniref:Uncharacterized protein n=1 Tax=Stachybotrys chlorohalonatus (strain IBT 40285) TaxID=1283841 RepID=A0A084QMB7_STAC4|nr:hypothetical protein S40285_10060 [Stachybotrys chlorohalonata IBT 40285]
MPLNDTFQSSTRPRVLAGSNDTLQASRRRRQPTVSLNLPSSPSSLTSPSSQSFRSSQSIRTTESNLTSQSIRRNPRRPAAGIVDRIGKSQSQRVCDRCYDHDYTCQQELPMAPTNKRRKLSKTKCNTVFQKIDNGLPSVKRANQKASRVHPYRGKVRARLV